MYVLREPRSGILPGYGQKSPAPNLQPSPHEHSDTEGEESNRQHCKHDIRHLGRAPSNPLWRVKWLGKAHQVEEELENDCHLSGVLGVAVSGIG